MTATSHYSDGKATAPKSAMEVPSESYLRIARRFTGAILMIAAVGLWLAPGASWDGELAFMKIGVFFFFALIGMTMFFGGKRPARQDG